MLQGDARANVQARLLRKRMSLPEVLLWQRLKATEAGMKFRRQHPAGPYVADFYCHKGRLVIEVDGSTHECADRHEADNARDRWFGRKGLLTVRIPASDVLQDADAIAEGLVGLAAQRAVAVRAADTEQL
ncbi:DUF559 domain-containing protein [Blastomonas sp. UPD001]|jgi:very-short-patch-repair endonuclease|uniref:endonuclease domain-containing protein n=1 Tax=Blastomonas sp. UPD001 TaxID=2217673 RepID=UPI000E344EAC|nr:DUF559 domain-containing protein [Blastomonas sp. UPD001]